MSKITFVEKEMLWGEWELIRFEGDIDIGDGVRMKMSPDEKLTYVIRHGDKEQFIFLTYQLEGNLLVTEQPSHPNKEKTEIYFEDDYLVLDYPNRKAWFKELANHPLRAKGQ